MHILFPRVPGVSLARSLHPRTAGNPPGWLKQVSNSIGGAAVRLPALAFGSRVEAAVAERLPRVAGTFLGCISSRDGPRFAPAGKASGVWTKPGTSAAPRAVTSPPWSGVRANTGDFVPRDRRPEPSADPECGALRDAATGGGNFSPRERMPHKASLSVTRPSRTRKAKSGSSPPWKSCRGGSANRAAGQSGRRQDPLCQPPEPPLRNFREGAADDLSAAAPRANPDGSRVRA